MKPLLKITDLCEYLSISMSKARYMVFKKEIPYFKVGAEIRFKLSDITEYLDRNRK